MGDISYKIIEPFRLDGEIRALRKNDDGSAMLVKWNGKSWVHNPNGRLADVFEEDAVRLSDAEAEALGAVRVSKL